MTPTRRGPIAAVCLGLGLFGGIAASEEFAQPERAPVQPVAMQLPREWNSLSPVVKRVLPAVVSIEGKGRGPSRPSPDAFDPGFGSGFLIDASGVVVTNNHVVRDCAEVEITLQDGRKFTSKDIRRDPKADLAVIRLDVKAPLPFLEFGDSDAMEVGDRVLAVGAPFGLTGSVSQGIVSGKSRNLKLNLYEDFLQTDAAVNPGNSGGPLVNMEGKVIGLTSAIKTRTGGFQGIGLAVSSRLAKTVSRELLKNGVVRRPYVGLAVADLDEATAAKLKTRQKAGVIVVEVFANSPAVKANFGVNDIVTAVNGVAVTTDLEMQRAISALPIGKEAEMTVMRNGQLFQTRIAVVEQPDTIGQQPDNSKARPTVKFETLGIDVSTLTAEVAARAGLAKDARGVMITVVAKNGLGELSGLAQGVVVVQVDRTPVAATEAFRAAVERADPGKGAVLHILKPDGSVEFVILKLE